MPRRTNSFELALAPRDLNEPAYRWLYSVLRKQILDGRLRTGARLPATRDLAAQFQLSRGTVVRAFEELKAEGYVEGTIGSGTYVSRVLPDEFLEAKGSGAGPGVATRKTARRLSAYSRHLEMFPQFENRPSRPFRANVPALDLFPMHLWAQLAARRLRRMSVSSLLVCDAAGYLPLRRAITDYLGASRGVKCVPEQVVIVAGIQEALDLVSRLFIDPGDRVCMEDPGYPGAASTFKAIGAKIVPVGMDAEGLCFERKKLNGSRLVYITPGHQFPLGITMSLPRRLQLLEWARNSGAILFEDDYDSEYRYSGRPVPALQGLDGHGLVIFAGSFSKVLFPSLRLGYLVVPLDLVDRFVAAISISHRHIPLLEQAILSEFITEGHFGRHLRRMRQIYAERFAALLEGAEAYWKGMLEIRGVEAGLQTAAWLGRGLTARSVRAMAALRQLELAPLQQYSQGAPVQNGLHLGFAAFDVKEIRKAVRELADVLTDAARSELV